MKKHVLLFPFLILPLNVKAQIAAPDTSVYAGAEVMPNYRGGIAEFYRFFSIYLHYPEKEKKEGIEGVVIAQFVVELDGRLSDIKIVRTPSEGLGREAQRLLAMSTRWIPGKQGGKDVRVMFTLPINFHLNYAHIPVKYFRDNPAGALPDDEKQIFTAVEIEPYYQGGLNEFYKYIANNIRYPEEDKKSGVQGRAIVQFIVEKNGSLSDIKVMRAPSETLGKEALRVMNTSPKWIPGKQGGKDVRVMFTVPINFNLGN